MAAPTDFHSPSNTPRNFGRSSKKGWVRILFFTCLLGVCLVAGLIAAGIFLIETKPVQDFIQTQVNTQIPGTLLWERFHLDLSAGSIRIADVHLKGEDGRELAVIPLVTVKIDWSGLTRHKIELAQIVIDHPVLDVSMSGQGDVDIVSALVSETGAPVGDPPPASDESPGFDFRVREFRVNQARITVTAPQFNADLPQLSVGVSDFKLSDLSASVRVALAGSHLGFGDTTLALESLDVHGRIENDNISDINVQLKMPGIELDAKGSVAQLFGTVTPDITAVLDLEAPLATTALGLPEDVVRGNGRLNLSINGGMDNPRGRIRFTFGQGCINNTAFSGIQVDANLEDKHLMLNESRVELPAGTIPFGGNVDLSQTFPKGFAAPMADLDTLAYTFFVKPVDLALAALQLGEGTPEGNVAAQIQVRGRGVIPGQMSAHATLDVRAHDLILPHMSNPATVQLKAGAELDKNQLTLTGLTLDGPGMTGAGGLHFDMPGFEPRAMTITGKLDLDVADISVPLSLVGQKGSGSATVHAVVQGALPAPDLTLDINAENLSSKGFRADEVHCKARMDKGLLRIEDLTLQRNQGRFDAAGTLSLAGKEDQNPALDLTAEFNGLELAELAPDLGARGTFSGKVTGGGSLANPNLQVALTGQAPGFDTYRLDSVGAQLNFADNILTVKQARILKNNAQMDITGRVNVADNTLDVRAVIPETDLKGIDPAADDILDSGRLGLDISARGALLAPEISGRINAVDLRLPNAPEMVADASAAITVRGALDNPESLQASVDISRLALARQGRVLVHMDNVKALLKEGRFTIDEVPVQIMDKGALTLTVDGDINGDLTAKASGRLPVSILVPLAEGVTFAEGDIRVALQATGKTTAPDLDGSVEFSNVTLGFGALEEPLQNVNGRIELTPQRADILDLTADLGAGKISLTGNAELNNGMPGTFKLNLEAAQVPVDVPDTLEMTLNSQLVWAGTMDKSMITGRIDIFEGNYYKDVDLSLVSIAAQATKKSRPKVREPGPDFLKNIGLNIYVTRREAIIVDNNLALMSISPNISVRGTAYAPSLDGRAVVDEGTIHFQKAEFEITEGSIDFINPYKIEPEIKLTGETTISSYTITLSVTGTPDDLVLKFSSDLDATDADILSLIAFGKTTAEMGGGSDDESLSASAIAKMMLDSFSEKIKDTTGLSEVSFNMDHEGDETSVHVGLGADLSRQLSVSYGIDISDGETVHTVTTYYKLLEHLLLSSSQSTSGKLGGELKYRLEFR